MVEPRTGQDAGLALTTDVFGAVVPDSRHVARCRREAEQVVATHAPAWVHLPRAISADPMARPVMRSRAQWPERARIASEARNRAQRYRFLLDHLLMGARVDVNQLLVIIDEIAAIGVAYPQCFAQMAMVETGSDDVLVDHAHATCCLGVAIAQRLGWSREHVRRAGLACLLADSGMALIDDEVHGSARPLTDIERNRVLRAPAFSVSVLEQAQEIPEDVLLAIYQHHEREDGSGYPAGVREHRITDLARLVSTADSFAAAAARRRYRQVKRPHEAVIEVTAQAAQGKLSRRMVKAMVESIGLFPVGSFVTLSNDQPAVIVSANAEAIDRPVVKILGVRPDGQRSDLTVDLAEFDIDVLRVVRAIDTPASMVS